MFLSGIARKMLPRRIYSVLVKQRDMFVCWLAYQSDFRRFWYYSHMEKGGGESALEAEILAAAHIIERGLSLPEPRLGYGKAKIESLIGVIRKYVSDGLSLDSLAYTNSVAVLRSYCEYHKDHGHDLGELGRKIDEIVPQQTTDAGYEVFSSDKYKALAQGDFRSCALSRYSVRAYGGEPVSEKKVVDALEISRKTPSVCNRQSWKAYWIKSEDAKARLMILQNGHTGFGYQVDSFLVVTTDLSTFIYAEERNQSFVDGGLYAMSLLYSLHYVGLGACSLNWSVSEKTDRKLKSELDIPSNENIIVVIAIGSLPDEVRVAKSCRKTVSDTLVVR